MLMRQKCLKSIVDGEFSGPCSELAISIAEAELNVKFSQQYRDFLSVYGSGFFEGVEVFGLPDPIKNNPPLWQDVVVLTKALRKEGQAGTENLSYIPIAEDGTGVYFFLDSSDFSLTKILAIGPGIEKVIANDLVDFVIDFSEGKIQY